MNVHADLDAVKTAAETRDDPLIDALIGVVDQLVDVIETHEMRLEGHSKKRDHIDERLWEIEDRLDATDEPEPTAADDATTEHQLLPIEQLAQWEEQEDVTREVPRQDSRAVTIWNHLPEWGTRTQAGIVLKTADGLKELLKAARPDDRGLHSANDWKQVYRACNALSDLSKGVVEYVDHNRHGKLLVLRDPDSLGGRWQGSSVGGG